MKLKLPEYNGKDNLVMTMICFPIAVIINTIYFGSSYFNSVTGFISYTAITAFVFALNFIFCGFIAVLLKARFSGESDLPRRLAIMISFFIMISALFLLSLFRLYEILPFSKTRFNENRFAWTCLSMSIVNIFITFLMEGIDRYNAWKSNLVEARKLSSAYKQSQLNGLKSQVNPHFLFNSLNSLSSLILEDEKKAEEFLDEMSKVYRYLLRNEEEKLVSLQTELDFLASYLHLLQARYGNGLKVSIKVAEADRGYCVAPLLLQVIIENAFTQNVVSKQSPLCIDIISRGNGALTITNTILAKKVVGETDAEAGLDNLIKGYSLLGMQITVEENNDERKIVVPLVNTKAEVEHG
jgi:two-component system LytT family sensor kinase